ncbi:MAG: FkbM family methyltransferase [Acidobacteria bacterium]|nr:FkbM family methyltransferase [Acidobacteriota bacterium]
MLSTATKVRLARLIVSALLGAGVAPVRRIRRRGIRYEIDFREGIDLSLFLFGTFQRHILRTIRRVVPPDGTILDVGANVGAITLPAAAHVAEGRVYAFEPTDFAWRKLQRNLVLNPQLASRVTPVRSFVAAEETAESSLVAYSSWPMLVEEGAELHPIHKGAAQDASCGQTTIDGFVAENGIASL